MTAGRKLRPAQTTAEKMIKVDHTGENGAVNIYRGQKLISYLRSPRLVEQLDEFQKHEQSHRQIFKSFLDQSGIRQCMSYHLAGLGGFALGVTTGLLGKSAIMATTYAVENVVLQHLEHQSDFLKIDHPEAHNCVQKIIKDEQDHHDHAFDNLDMTKFTSKLVEKTVRFCTEAVIRFGMR